MASTLPLTVLIKLSQSAYCRPYHLLTLSNNDTSIFIVVGQSPIFMLHNIYFLILFQTIQLYIERSVLVKYNTLTTTMSLGMPFCIIIMLLFDHHGQ